MRHWSWRSQWPLLPQERERKGMGKMTCEPWPCIKRGHAGSEERGRFGSSEFVVVNTKTKCFSSTFYEEVSEVGLVIGGMYTLSISRTAAAILGRSEINRSRRRQAVAVSIARRRWTEIPLHVIYFLSLVIAGRKEAAGATVVTGCSRQSDEGGVGHRRRESVSAIIVTHHGTFCRSLQPNLTQNDATFRNTRFVFSTTSAAGLQFDDMRARLGFRLEIKRQGARGVLQMHQHARPGTRETHSVLAHMLKQVDPLAQWKQVHADTG
ncbi:hypothetical protein RRG08_045489 [Elysia crispata]|uniref:Uncharacterized protein n=1 Tax=Elysia crispata TaxID=231223 RepID=A0AAE1DYD3_9GAST|nr:hypothetical protein RRG08_045489 [Elysia crispata]